MVALSPPEPASRRPPDRRPTFGTGFYDEERQDGLAVRWMSARGRLDLEVAPEPRFLELEVHSQFHDLSQVLSVEGAAGPVGESLPLVHGWNRLSLPVRAGLGTLTLGVSKPFPREHYPGDTRELFVLLRHVGLHTEAVRHGHVARQHANAVLNRREMVEGRVALESTPPLLGIDIQGACNINPPCVFCAWDYSKRREGQNVGVPFTTATLSEWGDFFENSSMLVNCSIGEPFMAQNVDALLDAFGQSGKLLELTTNGQILTDANIARVLGRDVHLYVSLDAASAETYARLRSPRFEGVLQNLRRLIAAKGGRGQRPLVYVVFMPMRANLHEVDPIVALCAELQADRLVLRPLNGSEGLPLVWDRAGYHFDYRQELLPFPELVRVSGRVHERCRQLGVDLSDQLDFGGGLQQQFPDEYEAGRQEARDAPAAAGAGSLTAPGSPDPTPATEGAPWPPAAPPASAPLPSLGRERLPACTEPWTSLYVLRRGTLPCCYGGAAIADMADFREAWNGRQMRSIRAELLRGRFHGYCHDSPDCPVVRKAAEAGALGARERLKRRLHGSARGLYRLGGRLWRRLRRSGR